MADFSVLAVPRYSFLENVPWLEAAKQTSALREMGQREEQNRIRNKYLEQQIQQRIAHQEMTDRYLEPTLRENLKGKRMRNAIQEHMINNPEAYQSKGWEIRPTQHGLYRINKFTGESMPVTEPAGGAPLMPISRSGLSISQTPAGQWRIEYGKGAHYTPTQAAPMATSEKVSQVVAHPGGDRDNLIEALGSAGSRYSPSGRVYTDPTTQASALVSPRATQTMMANRLVAENILAPEVNDYLNTVLKTMPKDTGIGARLHWKKLEALHALGNSPKSYQNYLSAKNSQINSILEKQLKVNGVSATQENMNALRSALLPKEDESRSEFLRNAANQVADLIMTKGKLSNYFVGGIPLSDNDKLNAKMHEEAFASIRDSIEKRLRHQYDSGLHGLGFKGVDK